MTALGPWPQHAVRWQDAVPDRQNGAAVTAGAGGSAAEPSDVALLGGTGTSTQSGFGMLVRRHSRVLYAIAYSRLRSASDAEEVVQDAFVLLWRKRGGVRLAGDSALPWLVVSVKHLAANRLRASRRRLQYERAAAEPDSSVDPQDVVTDVVEHALARLAPLDASIARLCLGEELTYAEAAARLGLTSAAVRNRLSRTRTRLRKDLEEER
jgi:RNA polymerase sigma factor (sigma-70 family)